MSDTFFLVFRVLISFLQFTLCVPSPFKRKGGGPEKKFGMGETKRGRKIFKMKGGESQLFKLNLGIKKGKDGDFLRQISINFFNKLPATAKDPFSLDIYCAW